MRPYRALFCAILHQAVNDVKRGGFVARIQAAHWLMESDEAQSLLLMLDLNADWFRRELARKIWMCKVYANPQIRGSVNRLVPEAA